MDSQTLSFEQFADFIRGWARVPARLQITLATQFERDLGITGDDGVELLEATEKQFNISLDVNSFGLAENEYLFGPESGFMGGLVSLFKGNVPVIRPFSVGELYEVVMKTHEQE